MSKNQENTASRSSVKKIKEKIKNKVRSKIKQIQEKGVNNVFLYKNLKEIYNFVGVYSQNELSSIQFIKIPFIIKLTFEKSKDSAWLLFFSSPITLPISFNS